MASDGLQLRSGMSFAEWTELGRRLARVADGSAWALGDWLMGSKQPPDKEAIYNHLKSWGVKGFFTAFMLAIVPPGFGDFVRGDTSQVFNNPVTLAFQQRINGTDALRTGNYSKTLTFTLSTTSP